MESAITAQFTPRESTAPTRRAWPGWTISGVIVAFLAFDIVTKFLRPPQVMEAFARTGWPTELSIPIGAILLVCTVLYMIPRVSVLGAAFLTAYLGGAVAANLRLEEPLFTHTLFPVYFGLLVWIGLWLREPKLRGIFPLVK